MDQAHVCLVTMTLRAQAFEMFRCDRPLSMGINIASFSKIMKCAGADDDVKIVADDSGPDCAEFIFENSSADRVAHFELKLMDIDQDTMNVPDDDEYQAIVNMPSADYRRIFSDLAIIGDTITIDVTKNNACFSVEGDIGTGSLNIQQSEGADGDDKHPVTINLNEPVKMTFPGKYLNMFTKAVPMSESVTLCIQDQHPLAIEFTLPGELGFVRYFLAPKIDQEDDDEEEGGEEGGAAADDDADEEE